MLSPADDALLNDLLDGRLAAAEEQACLQRLEREPELREAYDELQRARDFLRSAPDPVPPADFTARVRARRAAEPAEGAAVAASAPAAPGPSAPVIPPAWRRLMVVAYAAAAALVVGIGLVSLQRGQSGAPTTIESARVESSELQREKLRAGEAGSLDALPHGGLSAEPSALSAAPTLGTIKDKSAAGNAAEVEEQRLKVARSGRGAGAGAVPGAGAGAGAGGSVPAPSFRPGGAVPPGLRVPSDEPEALGARAPAPTSPSAPNSHGAPTPEPAPQPLPGHWDGPLDAPEQDAEAPGQPLADLLILEAASAAEGRALMEQVLAGPGAAVPDAKGFTRVRLRRADLRTDALLLVRLGIAQPEARADRPAAGGGAAARDAQPKAPVGDGAAPRARAEVPSVLADFNRVLSVAEHARLEALLGPLPAQAGSVSEPVPAAPAGPPSAAPTPSAPAPSAAAPSAPAASQPTTAPAVQRVRVIVLGAR